MASVSLVQFLVLPVYKLIKHYAYPAYQLLTNIILYKAHNSVSFNVPQLQFKMKHNKFVFPALHHVKLA